MNQSSNFIGLGNFFNNIGSNVQEGMLDEIAEWMISVGVEYHDNELNCNVFDTIELVKSVLVIGDDKKLHYKTTQGCSWLKICINNETPQVPSSLVIGKDIYTELVFDGVSQERMDEWKDRFVRISRLALDGCKINNWDWINDVQDSIGDLYINNTSIPNGFNGFTPKVTFAVEIRMCDIKNLDNFPLVGSAAEVSIISCNELFDISGLADKNKCFDLLRIAECSNITRTKNMQRLYIRNLYICDILLKKMIQAGELFGLVYKYISIAASGEYDYDEFNNIIKEVSNTYPSAQVSLQLNHAR